MLQFLANGYLIENDNNIDRKKDLGIKLGICTKCSHFDAILDESRNQIAQDTRKHLN